jgi:GR25 family glycosyltransferase involved in LPS biosynthesis
MKAFIITMSNSADSLRLSKVCKESILSTDTVLDVQHFEAVQPPQLYKHNVEIFDGEFMRWSFPERETENHLDFATGLFLKAYQTNDIKRVMACALSHMKLWKKCVDDNETIVILEHDAFFTRTFNPEDLVHDPAWGVVGLNDPRGNTRKGQLFHNIASAKEGIQTVPEIDNTQEPPLPMGIAGNSAYIIRPFAAKELLKSCKILGLWPNDAIMCKQLFPWLRVVYPYYSTTQRNVSSTTQVA